MHHDITHSHLDTPTGGTLGLGREALATPSDILLQVCGSQGEGGPPGMHVLCWTVLCAHCLHTCQAKSIQSLVLPRNSPNSWEHRRGRKESVERKGVHQDTCLDHHMTTWISPIVSWSEVDCSRLPSAGVPTYSNAPTADCLVTVLWIIANKLYYQKGMLSHTVQLQCTQWRDRKSERGLWLWPNCRVLLYQSLGHGVWAAHAEGCFLRKHSYGNLGDFLKRSECTQWCYRWKRDRILQSAVCEIIID